MTSLIRSGREYLRTPGDELHTDLGMLTAPEDVETGQTLKTRIGEEFFIHEPHGPDLFNHFGRIDAPMMPRDIGLIVSHTGVMADERVLDAGTDTGVLSAYLDHLGVDVTTLGHDTEFADVARENMHPTSAEQRANVRASDITDELDDFVDSGFDALTLDTGDTSEIARHVPDLLVTDDCIAVYSPFVESTRTTVETTGETGLSDMETFEVIQRRMDFDDHGLRSSTAGVGHTDHLAFARNK